jgi:hypothetical protein
MDPSDGSEFGRIASGSAVDIDRAVQAAQMRWMVNGENLFLWSVGDCCRS